MKLFGSKKVSKEAKLLASSVGVTAGVTKDLSQLMEVI